MRQPYPVVRGFVSVAARAIHGPPVPPTWQRRLGSLAAVSQTVPRGVTSTRVVLGGRPAVRWAAAGARTDAAVLWLHGGAFIACSLTTHRSFAAHLALDSGLPVYLLDQRLAPEHPYPAAVEDTVAAVPLVPEGRVVLGGDSAGGATVLLAAPDVEIAGLALVSPLVDLSLRTSARWEGKDIVVRAGWAKQGLGAMFPTGKRPDVPDPVVPTVVHVAEHEKLRAEGEALAARVGAELVVVPRGWHDIHLQCALVKEGREAVRQLGASVRRLAEDAGRDQQDDRQRD